jgi:predicted MPP superfamily phosphohydrolase
MSYPSDYVRVRESNFYSDKVNNDIKIVSIGDIHLSKAVALEAVDKLLRVIEEIKPDYICILGDVIDTPQELDYKNRLLELDVLMKNCGLIAPTFVIIGNHDYYYDRNSDTMILSDIWQNYERFSDVHVLKDKCFSDDNLFIGGYMQKGNAYYKQGTDKEDYLLFHEDLSKCDELVKDLPSDKYKIFLTHSPEPIQNELNQKLLSDYDLIMAGHYHNGVVPNFLEGIVPKHSGLLTPRRQKFPNEARGIVKLDTGTYLIYNGGWTKIPNCAKDIMKPLDVFFNRDIDVTTITNNYEYYDSYVKTKKLKI